MARAMEENGSMDIENIKVLNQIINLFDPPKDLNVGTYLSQRTNGTILKNIIKDLFVKKGETLPEDIENELIGVGDKKTLILERIARKYGKDSIDSFSHLDIMREKSPIGSDTKPSKLFLSQDNGPLDVVEQPTLILTVGSVLDPAGKTKTGALNLIEKYPNLERGWIQQLAMESAFSASGISVSARKNKDVYEVLIRSSVGDILGVFDTGTFVPMESNDAKYFLGNNEKNKDISTLLQKVKKAPSKDIVDTIKKYILVKELGDTLQVQWLNSIFANGTNKELNRSNTVIATTDSVVCFRSLVNKVGVIWTHQGKTTYYLPNVIDRAQEEAIRLSFINNISSSVLAHNRGVINILEALVKHGNDIIIGKSDGIGVVWIQELTWRVKSVKVAIELLEYVILKLKNICTDIENTFRVLANIDAAKQFAARSHFTSPFTYNFKKGQYFIVKTTTDLMDNKYFPFFALAFTNSNCETLEKAKNKICGTLSIEQPIPFERTSGIRGRRMRGGDPIKNTLEMIFNNSDRPLSPLTEIGKEAIRRYEIDSNITLIAPEDIILQNPDIDSPAFLYCYVRDYHPEIFTFALIQRYAIEETGEVGIEFLRRNLPHYTLLTADYKTRHFPEGSYSYINREIRFTSYFENVGNSENSFQEYYAIPPRDLLDEIFKVTMTSVLLAYIYLEQFPQVMSPYLRFFMSWIQNKVQRQLIGLQRQYSNIPMVLEEENDEIMMGGGASFMADATNNALAIHSLYFTRKIKAIYEDKFDSEKVLFETLTNEYKSIQNKIKNISSGNNLNMGTVSLPKRYLAEGIRVGGKTRKVNRLKRRKTRRN